ncbi:MAG: type II toxin-antitoxin system prevent-host-death family antitoxin [Candidatus Rokubacteria bacterium]|nr:type II toxin-antitoxin system prevent-host-death family antitoxin [Candidatus Rokubacteria bacterium]
MKRVGLRELKNRLSEYVRHVRAGHRVLVTDRGVVIAELRPPHPRDDDLHPGLAELARRGSLRSASPRSGHYPELRRLVPDGTAVRLLDELRGER